MITTVAVSACGETAGCGDCPLRMSSRKPAPATTSTVAASIMRPRRSRADIGVRGISEGIAYGQMEGEGVFKADVEIMPRAVVVRHMQAVA